jgi:hypothetical protein
MPVVPNKLTERIEFYENHVTPWNTNATAIGTTTAAVTHLSTKTVAARDAFNAQQAAQDAAKAATHTQKMAIDAMETAGASIIKQVRSKAAISGDSVYTLAQIPAPATPSPRPAPGTPANFTVDLFQDGSLELKWKCANPAGSSGTIYQVWRRVEADGQFEYLGGSGLRKYIDNTIPAGSSQVTYQIQAVRSTAVGAFAQFNVNFGTNSAGSFTASVSEDDQSPKLAA